MLLIEGLEVTYGTVAPALNDVSITVEEGSLVAVLGSNGAGKTTLLRAVSNVLGHYRGAVTGGSMSWAGVDLVRSSSARIVEMGVVQTPEGRGIFGGLTVEENLRIAAFVRSRAAAARTLDEVLGRFPDLSSRLTQRAGSLSGGQQQMLAIGRALMAEPTLLLMDEPSLGLAPRIVDEVADVVASINNNGTTVVLVEQNASMALELTDHAYVLENGRVSLHGPSAELARSEDVQRLYLGMDPEIERESARGPTAQSLEVRDESRG